MFHYALDSAKGTQMWGRFIYREINSPRRMVFVTSFSDPDGGVTHAPFAGDWPLEMLTTLSLDEQDGRTVDDQLNADRATEAEHRTRRHFSSMTQGWGAHSAIWANAGGDGCANPVPAWHTSARTVLWAASSTRYTKHRRNEHWRVVCAEY
jgi:hypothetical protein